MKVRLFFAMAGICAFVLSGSSIAKDVDNVQKVTVQKQGTPVEGYQCADSPDYCKGNYTPEDDYILSGGLIKDLPAPIEVPVNYTGKGPVNYTGEGFAAERLTKVGTRGIKIAISQRA